jgi:fibrillarin-like pre-rRNA processing protein
MKPLKNNLKKSNIRERIFDKNSDKDFNKRKTYQEFKDNKIKNNKSRQSSNKDFRSRTSNNSIRIKPRVNKKLGDVSSRGFVNKKESSGYSGNSVGVGGRGLDRSRVNKKLGDMSSRGFVNKKESSGFSGNSVGVGGRGLDRSRVNKKLGDVSSRGFVNKKESSGYSGKSVGVGGCVRARSGVNKKKEDFSGGAFVKKREFSSILSRKTDNSDNYSNFKERKNHKKSFSKNKRDFSTSFSKKENKSNKLEFQAKENSFNNKEEKFTQIKFPNTFIEIKNRKINLFTKNLNKGETYFGEKIITKKIEQEYLELRSWEATKSKLGAAIALKISQLGIYEGSKVLYLGASHGFTPSYVSDMVGENGFVFCLDFAPRVVRDLYLLCQKRKNMSPILGNANNPEEYEKLIPEVDVIFMDIAQREQVKIFLKNFKFLKKGGFGLLALKARSIDVTRKPKHIFNEARLELEKHTLIVDYKELDPYEKDHCFFVCKKD